MARPTSPLQPDALEGALDYLRRAIDRNALIFSKPPSTVASSFLDLGKRLPPGDQDARADLVNKWVGRNVTAEGRKSMLSALRRRKADAAAGAEGSKTIRVSSRTYTALQQLAQTLGMPKATALDNLVQVALSDKTLQAAVTRLALARTIAQPAPKNDG